MKNIKNGILIVSHPDDECLFASSILDKVSTLIICFENLPFENKITFGRKNSTKNYPLKKLTLINLCLSQANKSFIPNNWFSIKDDCYGIRGGYKEKSYRRNFKTLLFELRKYIPPNSTLISHNPWGEYGHEEHCQLFKVVFKIAKETNSDFYVSGYCGNLSIYFAKRKLHLLNEEYSKFKTNKKLFSKLKNHYFKNGCWTWYKDYDLPSFEIFFKVNLKLNPKSLSCINNCNKIPLIFINNNNPLIFFIKEAIKRFLPFHLKYLVRGNRVYQKN